MHLKLLVLLGTMALALTACPGPGDDPDVVIDDDAPVDDVDPADVESHTLSVATLYGPEQWQSTPLADYAVAIEEATGGNISFDFFYGDALLPPAELATGLADGIADLAYFVHVYTPADFPIDDWISKIGFLADTRPVVGPLQAVAATLEWGFEEEDYLAELDTAGLAPVLPRFAIVHEYHLLCQEPVISVADAQGKRVRIGGEAWADEGSNLGMEPVALAGGEVYEGFERGIVDCFMGGLPDMTSLGLWDVGQQFTEAGFTGFTSYSVSLGRPAWDAMSPDAQRVLWDNIRVYLDRLMRNYIEETHRFFTGGEERGLQFHELDEEARQQVEEHHSRLRDTLPDQAPPGVTDPEGMIRNYEELHDKWLDIVLDLGYDPGEETWAEWAEANPDGPDIDLGPWLDAVEEQILAPNRP